MPLFDDLKKAIESNANQQFEILLKKVDELENKKQYMIAPKSNSLFVSALVEKDLSTRFAETMNETKRILIKYQLPKVPPLRSRWFQKATVQQDLAGDETVN